MSEPDVIPDEVRRLRLEPGDRLIVRCTSLTPQQQVEYREYLQAHFEDNEVLVIFADEIAVQTAAPDPQFITATVASPVMSDDEMDRLVAKIGKRLGPEGGTKVLLR